MADVNRNLLVWYPKGSLNIDSHKDAISHTSGDYTMMYDMNLSNNEKGTDGVLNPLVSALNTYNIPHAKNRNIQRFYIRKRRQNNPTIANASVRLEFYDINYERFTSDIVNSLSTIQAAINNFPLSGLSVYASFGLTEDYEFSIIIENTLDQYFILHIADDNVKGASRIYQYGMIDDVCRVSAKETGTEIPMSFAGHVPFEDGFFAFYTACNYRYYETEAEINDISASHGEYFRVTPSKRLDIPKEIGINALIHYCEIITDHIGEGVPPETCYFDGVWPMIYDGTNFLYSNAHLFGINPNGYALVENLPPPGSKIRLRVGHITYGRIYYFKRITLTNLEEGFLAEYKPELIYDGMGMGFNPYHKCYGNAVRVGDEVVLTFHRWRLGPPTQIVFNKEISTEGILCVPRSKAYEAHNGSEFGYYNLPYLSTNNMRFPSAYENVGAEITSLKIIDNGGKIRVGPKKYYLKYKYHGDSEYRYKIFEKEILAYNKGPAGTTKTIHGGLSSEYTNLCIEVNINSGFADYKEFYVGCIEKTGPMSFNTNIIFSLDNNYKQPPTRIIHSHDDDFPDTDMQLFLEANNVIYDIDSIELCNNRMFFGNFSLYNFPPPYLTNRTVKHNLTINEIQTQLSPHEMLSGLEWYRADGGINEYDLRGYCINEIYRFGFIGIGHDGTVSVPRWLTDIIIDLKNINDPKEDSVGYGDRAFGINSWYMTLGYNDKNYNTFIEFRNILRMFARNRYRDFVLIRDERIGRVQHNSIGFLTQFDAEMTFSSGPVFYLYSKGQSDPVNYVGNTFPTYLTFNRASFPINYIKNTNIDFVNQNYNNLMTGHMGVLTANNLYTGGYIMFATHVITNTSHPYYLYFQYFVVEENAQYVAVGTPHHRYAISCYAKQFADYGFLENTILMLFSPEDLLLGAKNINPSEHSLRIFHGNLNPTNSFVTKIRAFNENSWFEQGPNDLMGASQYVPRSKVGMMPQIINISFDGLYTPDDIAKKSLNDVKYVSRGQQAIFQRITTPLERLPRFVYGIEWMPLLGNQNKRKLKAKPLVYNSTTVSTNGATIATCNHYVIDKKDASILWASYPATTPFAYENDSDINMWQGNSPLTPGDMWVPNSKQFVYGLDLLDYYDNPQHLCLQGNDFLDIAKNSHRFYYETESGYVVQTTASDALFDGQHPYASLKSQLLNLYNKTGFIFFCQIIKDNAYQQYLQENAYSFKNAIVTNVFEKCFEGDTAREWTCFTAKGDTYVNVITHKIAYPRKENFYYKTIDEKNAVLGLALRYVIPSFVNFAARNVLFSKVTDGVSSSNTEAPAWPQNQHTIKEYLPNYNNDAYGIDPMYANEIMPPIVKSDSYDYKKNRNKRLSNILTFSNPLTTRDNYALALKIIPQNIRNMPYEGGEITNMVAYGAYLIVMQKNSLSQFVKTHSNNFITPDDGDEIFIRATSEINLIPNMSIGYSVQQKDAIALVGKSSNNLNVLFYDSYKRAIVQINGFQTIVRSLKNNSLFKRRLDALAGEYNEKRFGVFAIKNPRTEEVIFVFRPKYKMSKPWLPDLPGISYFNPEHIFDIDRNDFTYSTAYYGDMFEFETQTPAMILMPYVINEETEHIISEYNYIPVFYKADVEPDSSVANEPPGSSDSSGRPIWVNTIDMIPFAVSVNYRADGIQNFYRFMPYEIINAELDGLVHIPRHYIQVDEQTHARPLLVLSSDILSSVIGQVGPINSKGVVEVVFNAGRPVVLRNIYVQSDIQPEKIVINSRAGTSSITSFTKKNDQYIGSVPNTSNNRSHIDISFRVRVVFPTFTNKRPNLSYIIAVVSDEPTGPGLNVRL